MEYRKGGRGVVEQAIKWNIKIDCYKTEDNGS